MRVDFKSEVGLLLCVSDLKIVNFMKDGEGRIVAVDFGGYSFLPPSFFALALTHGGFAHRIASSGMLEYPAPPSTNVSALESASSALAPFSSNDVGEQISLLSFFPLPLALLQEHRAHCTVQAFRGNSDPDAFGKPSAQSSHLLNRTACSLFSFFMCVLLLRLVDSPEGGCFVYFRRLFRNV